MDRVRAGVGEALPRRGDEPAGRGRGAPDVLQLPEGPVEDAAHHQQHRAVERGVPPPRQDAGLAADRSQRGPPPLRASGHGADHAAQARRLHATRRGGPAADAARRVTRTPRGGISRYGWRADRAPEANRGAALAHHATLDPAHDPEECPFPISTSSGTPPLHSLACDFEGQERTAGKVDAWPRQTLRESGLHRIAADGEEDGNVLECPSGANRRETGDDQGDVRLCQLRGPCVQRLQAATGVSNLEGDRLAFDVAELSQTFAKSLQERIGLRSCRQPANARWLARLLCLDGNGRGEEAASQTTDERPPVHHSIT